MTGRSALLYSVVDPREAGGAQTVMRRLSEDLRERGWRVRRAWGGPPAPEDAGDATLPLYVRSGGRAWHAPSIARAAALLARERPDIVHAHFLSEQTLYLLRLAPLFGARVALTAHGSDLRAPAPGWRDRLPEIIARADALTVVSRDLAEQARAVATPREDRVFVIPNGVDTAFWTPGDRLERSASRGPLFVAAGRLEAVKGFDLLLRAFAQLRERAPEARLEIAGEGPERRTLEELVAALGLSDHVSLPGRLSPEALRERFRDATAIVLSSRSEGLPLTLIEGMACGAAVVATRVGGVPELVRSDLGRLVPPEDPRALADAMEVFALDARAARLAGAEAAVEAQRWSARAAAADYETVYEAALSRSPRRGGAAADAAGERA